MSLDNNTTTNREALNATLQAIESEVNGNLDTTDITTTNLTVNGTLYVASSGEIDFATKTFTVGKIELKDDLELDVPARITTVDGAGFLELNSDLATGAVSTLANGNIDVVLDNDNLGLALRNFNGENQQAILIGSTQIEIVGDITGDFLLSPTNGLLKLTTLQTYANNAAAISGGLTTSTVYQTSTGELRIVV